MANYNRIKASKSVPIGTIMPWTGSSSTSRLVDDSIPNGWIVCRGQTLRAIDYPLLAQLLGNEYGPFQEVGGPVVGIQNDYPYYGEDDYFNLPNLNQTSLVDLEGSRLDVEDIVVVGQYITRNGSDAAPLNLITSYVDVNFQIEPDSQLSGRLTGVTLQEPAFFDTYTVIPRKLGVDHTPGHTHPRPADGYYPSASPSGSYIALFTPGNYETQDSKWTTASAIDFYDADFPADRFSPGVVNLTWYDPENQSLPTMDTFLDLTTSSPYLPGTRVGTTRNISASGPTENPYADDYSCANGEEIRMGAWAGQFPPPGLYQGRNNFYAAGDVSNDRSAGTYPVTLNHNADSWNSTSLLSHTHFTIDVAMTGTQMRVPGTILINNMTTGTVNPVSVDRALSVQINPNTPSLTTLIIMRAY